MKTKKKPVQSKKVRLFEKWGDFWVEFLNRVPHQRNYAGQFPTADYSREDVVNWIKDQGLELVEEKSK